MASSVKLTQAVQRVLRPTYFPSIPLAELKEALQAQGVHLLDVDGTPWEGFLLGAQGRCVIDLGISLSTDNSQFRSLNRGLALQWYKMPSGKIEVNGYIT